MQLPASGQFLVRRWKRARSDLEPEPPATTRARGGAYGDQLCRLPRSPGRGHRSRSGREVTAPRSLRLGRPAEPHQPLPGQATARKLKRAQILLTADARVSATSTSPRASGPHRHGRLVGKDALSREHRAAEPSKMLAVVPRWFLRGGQQNHLCAFTAYSLEIQHITGEPGGTRTHDPLIKSQVLYRLSYGLRAACVGGGLFPVNSGAAGFKRKWRLFG